MTHISFLGGVGTVTGSKFLVETDNRHVLVDCGLFQGLKQHRLRNWDRFPVEPASIHAVVLTHAHLDHSGYLPLLVRSGFKGTVLCTEATRDLCSILLPDSGHLQERDAEFANRHGFSKHKPALPLYTEAEARACLDRLEPQRFGTSHALGDAMTVRFLPAGHILGAAMVEIATRGGTVLFSGDLGRPNSPTMVDPAIVGQADYLLIESTYGNRTHDPADALQVLADVINKTARRGGTILVPTFAVGRAQTLLYFIRELKTRRMIPDMPVYLDSPMAIDASHIFCAHLGEHRLTELQCRDLCAVAHYVNDVEGSKALDRSAAPKVVLAASGMATGGRVLHHLKALAPDVRNTIVFAGFQAPGTRGAAMVGGAESVIIHGADVPVRAEVRNLSMLSAHADREEIMAWLTKFTSPPRMTFVVHGEPAAADSLRLAIEERLGWPCQIPAYLQRVKLGADVPGRD
ncbi:MAG TPA: MBL fold metallo-hydrolase [Vineibacter sp.]|nr:MBL fold metallo-hydrolase [Vineibacter sp.]